jgi:hypothetical protein
MVIIIKITLINAFEKAKKGKVFENIESSILWQQEIRNEWE